MEMDVADSSHEPRLAGTTPGPLISRLHERILGAVKAPGGRVLASALWVVGTCVATLTILFVAVLPLWLIAEFAGSFVKSTATKTEGNHVSFIVAGSLLLIYGLILALVALRSAHRRRTN